MLAVWVPVVVRLIKPVILLERVIKVAVCPVGVWLNTKEPGHLGLAVRLPIILSTYGVQFLVKIGVDDLVSEVVVWLLPVVLGVVRRSEVDRHLY